MEEDEFVSIIETIVSDCSFDGCNLASVEKPAVELFNKISQFTEQEMSAIEFQANRLIPKYEEKSKEVHLGEWLTKSTLSVWKSIKDKCK